MKTNLYYFILEKKKSSDLDFQFLRQPTFTYIHKSPFAMALGAAGIIETICIPFAITNANIFSPFWTGCLLFVVQTFGHKCDNNDENLLI